MHENLPRVMFNMCLLLFSEVVSTVVLFNASFGVVDLVVSVILEFFSQKRVVLLDLLEPVDFDAGLREQHQRNADEGDEEDYYLNGILT